MDIPEVLQTIAKHLDPKSLVAASMVSHHWHTCISPLIWDTIHPADWTHPSFRPRTLYARAHLVRTLGWHATTSSVYQQSIAARTLSIMATDMAGLNLGLGLTPTPPSSMIQFDVREGDSFLKLVQDQQQQSPHKGQEEGKAADEDGSSSQELPATTTTGFVSVVSPPTTTTITTTTTPSLSSPHAHEPVQDQLSLVCLNKIMGQCVNLQRLCLHTITTTTAMGSKNSEGGGGIHVDMIPVLQSLVYLQTLELYINRVVVYQEENVDSSKDGGKRRSGVGGLVKTVESGIMIQDLVRRLNQLSTLSLRGTAFIFNTHPSASEKSTTTTANSTTADKPRFSIQHLILDTPYITEEELSTFLTHCPRLESLDLPGGLPSWTWSDAFLTTLRTSNRHLCEFSINASAHPPILEDRLVALVRQGFCRPLKRFGARACQFEEGTIFQALLDQQSSSMEGDEGEGEELEVLDISLAKRVGPLFRGRLYEFLNRTKGLKRLEADGVWISLDDLSQNNEQQDAENGEQDDEGVEEGDAAGAGITALQGQHPLLPIDQHDLETNNSTPTPTPQQRPQCPGIASRNSLTRLHIGFTHPSRSTRHLQGMYALLSTLHNLTHLQLSYTCLNLPTAESGFHQLETLSRLQVFNIETCGYSALTREDLAWMVRSWPRLEKLVLNQLGASQERAMRGWLSEFGRDDLLIETSRPSGMYF